MMKKERMEDMGEHTVPRLRPEPCLGRGGGVGTAGAKGADPFSASVVWQEGRGSVYINGRRED